MQREFSAPFEKIVFCDFDGTITRTETYVEMFHAFVPDLVTEIGEAMRKRELTLRQGITTLVESIPSRRYPEIIRFIGTRELRPGFAELLDFLDHRSIPFVIISAGQVALHGSPDGIRARTGRDDLEEAFVKALSFVDPA